jgi:hypothetical protein
MASVTSESTNTVDVCDDQVDDGCDQEEHTHGDRVEAKEQGRAEACLEPAHTPPADPTDERIRHNPADGQGHENGFSNALILDVGKRDRQEQNDECKLPHPKLSPTPGALRRRRVRWCFHHSARPGAHRMIVNP